MTQTLRDPKTGLTIPSKYTDMGVCREWKPTPLQRQRMFISGFPGHGKSNFVMSNPHAIVFDFEDSCRDVVNPQASRVYRPNFKDYIDILAMLAEDGRTGNAPFKHVVFDTVDKFLELTMLHLTEEHNATLGQGRSPLRSITEYGTKGAGWYLIREYITGILSRLYAAGYGWTVVGHITLVESDDEPTRTKAVLPPSLLGALYREAQFMMHVDAKTIKETQQVGETEHKTPKGRVVKKPVFQTTEHQEVSLKLANVDDEVPRDLKARYLERLPSSIHVPLDAGWKALETEYTKATS